MIEFKTSDGKSQKAKPSPRILPVKQFEVRESLLSGKEYSSFFTIVVIVISLALINSALEGKFGSVVFDTLCGIYGDIFNAVLITYIAAPLFGLIPYYGLKLWAKGRGLAASKHVSWNRLWTISFIGYVILHFYLFTKLCLCVNLNPVIGLAAFTRIFTVAAKIYSFVRENVPKLLKRSPKASFPTLFWYIYFLYCPTLIYRDSYPRTDAVRWRKIVCHVFEILLGNAFTIYVFKYFVEPNIIEYSGDYVRLLLGCMVPSFLIICCLMYYAIMHSWLNLWSEMLRFGDRLFYSDWWTSDSQSYFRKWNKLGNDWLYTYVYKDLQETVWVGNRFRATVAAFLVSAPFHEYVFLFAVRFSYGILTLSMMAVGVILGSNIRVGNRVLLIVSFAIHTILLVPPAKQLYEGGKGGLIVIN